MTKEIPIVFHNRLKYDYHFIIKRCEGEFNCPGENTEKYKTFSVPITKAIDYKRNYRNHILQIATY